MTVALKPIAEQVIVVTGASSGIGLVTARQAAARGASVVLVARGEEALAAAVRDIDAAGGTAAYAVADVGVLADVRAAAKVAIDRFGRIDTWVNNAGVAIYAELLETPMEEHERLFRTNYFGAVHGALTAIEHLRQSGGALVTVSSIVADFPSPIMGAYAASKHAVEGYIGSLRMETVADRLPVSITLVKPSGISTPIARHAANHVDGEALIPIPVYDPALVAEAILDAAEHPRRDVTVGGIGRLQSLLSTHFPAILDHLGRVLEPLLHDPKRPATSADNLSRAGDDDGERSPDQPGRPFSIYRHRGLVTAMVAAAALGALALPRLAAKQAK